MKNPLKSALLIGFLAGCASAQKHLEAEQTVLARQDPAAYDYSRFEQRRQDPKLIEAASARGFEALPDPTVLEALNNAQPITNDPPITEYLEGLVAEIVEHWDAKNSPSFNILIVDAQHQLPVISRGGTIIIPIKALQAAKSFDEFEFIMAHEISHGLLDHFEAKEKASNTKSLISGASVLAATIAGETNNEGAGNKAIISAALANYLINENIDRWNKEQEVEADLLALDLITKMGANFNGALELLQRSSESEIAQREAIKEHCGNIPKTGMFSDITNALSSSLRQSFQVSFSEKGEPQNEPQDPWKTDAICINYYKKINAKSHYPFDERYVFVKKYRAKHYDTLPPKIRTLKHGLVTQLSPQGAVQRILNANKALEALAEGDIRRAEKLAYDSLDGADDATSKPRFALYNVRRAQYEETGQDSYRKSAIKNLDIALKRGTASKAIHIARINEYIESSEFDRANGLISTMDLRFSNTPELPLLALKSHGAHAQVAYEIYPAPSSSTMTEAMDADKSDGKAPLTAQIVQEREYDLAQQAFAQCKNSSPMIHEKCIQEWQSLNSALFPEKKESNDISSAVPVPTLLEAPTSRENVGLNHD
ncbi:hypothetical protein CCR85_03845 [Rhodothalassium salexigens]|uniref:M48 family metalloprotease n=1 Tax=Rhodothalassium salexigens TaxID=1086 RepID=UPI0019143B9D|nr:M48 family metalloprotease [Rhodothalassium salexigens]MBK5910625.1 hypothetical protein [Rhodothalassium salexigens]MBK5920608.1 hypothetical protein [Rhodothalassium salexigens]